MEPRVIAVVTVAGLYTIRFPVRYQLAAAHHALVLVRLRRYRPRAPWFVL